MTVWWLLFEPLNNPRLVNICGTLQAINNLAERNPLSELWKLEELEKNQCCFSSIPPTTWMVKSLQTADVPKDSLFSITDWTENRSWYILNLQKLIKDYKVILYLLLWLKKVVTKTCLEKLFVCMLINDGITWHYHEIIKHCVYECWQQGHTILLQTLGKDTDQTCLIPGGGTVDSLTKT